MCNLKVNITEIKKKIQYGWKMICKKQSSIWAAQIWSIKYCLWGTVGKRQRAQSWEQNERESQSEKWMKNITGGQNIIENVFQAYKGPQVTLKKAAE